MALGQKIKQKHKSEGEQSGVKIFVKKEVQKIGLRSGSDPLLNPEHKKEYESQDEGGR
jgi:hypothetical protein